MGKSSRNIHNNIKRMIDLNKYYISTTYQGASGGSEGRSGFVPKALSGDETKFLRGDGTWSNIILVNPNNNTKWELRITDSGSLTAVAI